jgi:hypothetical protein
MDALFFARVRHIGSASIYNNGVVWLDSVAATDFARLRARTDCPSLHQSAHRQGRCNDPAVDVSPDKFGFDEQLSEGRHASDRRSSARRRCPAGITNPPFPLIMGRREKSARPLALGATYENISTSMTGTKCITRGHKRFKRVQKGSKGLTRRVRNAPNNQIGHGFASCERINRPLMINFGQREG